MVSCTVFVSRDYCIEKIEKVRYYSIEKMLFVGVNVSLNNIFKFIEEIDEKQKKSPSIYIGSNSDYVFKQLLSPDYLTTKLRQEFIYQNLKKGFSDRDKYEKTAYASLSSSPDHWSFYTNAPKEMNKIICDSWNHIMSSGKEYFSNYDNLKKFFDKKEKRIVRKIKRLSPEAQEEILTKINFVYFYDYRGQEDYISKFLERRRSEGGDQLVEAYSYMAGKILSKF